MDLFQEYIFKSRYARFLWDEGRRETWPEAVQRYVNYIKKRTENKLEDSVFEELQQAILNMEIMPSMRLLMTAGATLDAHGDVCAYNCSYIPVDSPRAFDEILYVLMCGTGVGFSVERSNTNKLPVVADEFFTTETTIKVQDSKIGWAKALKELIHLLYGGQIPIVDVSLLRPQGAPLKTFGGRSSGPGPLMDLVKFSIALFKKAAGRRLTSLECHDLVCKIADVVVVGGVRRSALIGLSDLEDPLLKDAKAGNWYTDNVQRALANNTWVYDSPGKPDIGTFMNEWVSLYESKSGERGIFNRYAAKDKIAELTTNRDPEHEFGLNPCAEILLRPYEFCNLTEVVCRSDDTKEDLERKIQLAAILGTIQSSLTNFKYINRKWKQNCEEERLLGVSLTGIMDCKLLNSAWENSGELLSDLRKKAISVNKLTAETLDIPASKAVTCVKPSGTVSSLVDSSPGIHTRYAPFYIRRVRADINDPLCRLMIDQGIPYEKDITKPSHTLVFSFPIKAPKGSVYRDDWTALEHLEHYLLFLKNWCDHNPSITVTVRENEWMQVGSWLYDNFEDTVACSFLPHSDMVYQQAPYEEITEETYNKMKESIPKTIDWEKLKEYEKYDQTNGSQELACVSGACNL